jgi:uncharacterized protein (TIGR02147 family)
MPKVPRLGILLKTGKQMTMKNHQFSQFKDFFEYQLRENTRDTNGKKMTTLQALANKMGYKSPSLLSMISKGHRLPSKSLMEALFNEWKIEKRQREILRLRVEIEKKLNRGKNTYPLITKLTKLAPIEQYHLLDVDQFSSMRDWYILVLRVLVDTPDFNEDPVQISQRLRRKVTPSQVQKGLELLEKLRFIERNIETGKLQSTVGSVETSNDIPSEAIREHHRGMIQKALESIDEQNIQERVLNSLTLKLDLARMLEAKEKIMNFVKDFNAEFAADNSRSIYQLNVQLFEHTKKEEGELS